MLWLDHDCVGDIFDESIVVRRCELEELQEARPELFASYDEATSVVFALLKD